MPLEEIRRVLEQPAFDTLAALERHYAALMAEEARIAVMLRTIEKTIRKLRNEDEPMALTDAELYEGLSQETVERWQKEVNETYDPALVAESNRRVRKLSKEQWNAIKEEGGAVTLRLAELFKAGIKPESAEAQTAIEGQRRWIEHFYTPSAEMFRGLGELYATHPEFRANYDKYAKDFADFMHAAMAFYADHSMKSSHLKIVPSTLRALFNPLVFWRLTARRIQTSYSFYFTLSREIPSASATPLP